MELKKISGLNDFFGVKVSLLCPENNLSRWRLEFTLVPKAAPLPVILSDSCGLRHFNVATWQDKNYVAFFRPREITDLWTRATACPKFNGATLGTADQGSSASFLFLPTMKNQPLFAKAPLDELMNSIDIQVVMGLLLPGMALLNIGTDEAGASKGRVPKVDLGNQRHSGTNLHLQPAWKKFFRIFKIIVRMRQNRADRFDAAE